MQPIQCFRVWFSDESCICIDAVDEDHARTKARKLALPDSGRIVKVENLSLRDLN